MVNRKKAAEPERPLADDESETSPINDGNINNDAGEEESAVIEPAPGELNDAIDGLGQAIDRAEGATGGYDISESGHQSAIERMEQLGETLELDTGSLVAGTRDFLLDIIKSRPKPWSASSQAEQRDVAAACEQLAIGLVRQIVEIVRSDGREPVRVLLTKVMMGDDIQITGKLKPMSEDEEEAAVIALHHARGKHVLLTVASVDDYRTEHREAETEPDERPLPFEAGGEEVEDSVLEGEDLEEEEAEADRPFVNLKTGMVETLDGEGGVTEREATPAELAAERERVAMFDESEAGAAADKAPADA